MAEVTRSPFDLRSWQGLTAVLKAARESSLSPTAYAEFRNIVLEYAQKGGDAELKKKIDAIIVTFGTPDEKKASDMLEPKATAASSSHPDNHTGGRRITPTFTATKTHAQPETTTHTVLSQEVSVPHPPISIGKEETAEEKKEVVVAEVPVPPLPVSQSAHIPESLMTLEESRARIMEIKHRVNALVGNPATLMDKGNGIGRAYMGALLTAMKATSPGSTMNTQDAMQKLEASFLEILNFTATKNDTVVAPTQEPSIPKVPPPPTLSFPSVPEIKDHEIITTVSELPQESRIPPVSEVPFTIPVPPPVSETALETPIESNPPTEQAAEAPFGGLSEDARWSADDEEISKRAVREAVEVNEKDGIPTRAVERGRRSFLPSLVDIEEDVSGPQSSSAEPTWHAHTVPDDLSTASVMRRPESPMTGVTLGTPQSELMSKEVTAALAQLLHEWNIFSSSGLFGMGPGGMDHPVYQQIASLTMGEVLSSRWENANHKVAHSVKNYVDAWRHEQGISYTPTETFEHYLRRVAQRIMKRKHGEIIVS